VPAAAEKPAAPPLASLVPPSNEAVRMEAARIVAARLAAARAKVASNPPPIAPETPPPAPPVVHTAPAYAVETPYAEVLDAEGIDSEGIYSEPPESYDPPGEDYASTAEIAAAEGIDEALKVLEGRWKMIILFHLFSGGTRRFSELERSISGITQKMLIQQLRELEQDGIVERNVHPVVPPRVEYSLTDLGRLLVPALDELLIWARRRKEWREGTLNISAL
jgi:DNA-binding HxlR family transcriptional regulator